MAGTDDSVKALTEQVLRDCTMLELWQEIQRRYDGRIDAGVALVYTRPGGTGADGYSYNTHFAGCGSSIMGMLQVALYEWTVSTLSDQLGRIVREELRAFDRDDEEDDEEGAEEQESS